MNQNELYINDLSEAKDRLKEIRANRKPLTPKQNRELCDKVAAIFDRYERDMEQRAAEEEKEQRRADYCYF